MQKEKENEENGNDVVQDMVTATQVKSVIGNKGYIKGLKRARKYINDQVKEKDKDRMTYAYILLQIIGLMGTSIEGWTKWCNIGILVDIPIEDMETMIQEMTSIMDKWIEIDIEVTKKKMKRMIKELATKGVKIPKLKKSDKEKHKYVA